MYYDTHCHPYLSKQKSQDTILENFFAHGGVYLNSISTNLRDSTINIELTKKYTGVYASIGIHPVDCIEELFKENPPESLRSSSPLVRGIEGDFIQKTIQELETLYTENPEKIVAIGECGLDYYWIQSLSERYGISQEEIKEIQTLFFRAQIQLAKKLGLPLVIHNRESGEDIFQILTEEDFKNFVFHCFTENLEFAERLIKFAPECKLGFGGVTTFKSAESVREVVRNIPLKNIIIETDAPYLTPLPYRGKQENEPLFVKYVLDTITDLRTESFEEIQKTIYDNSVEFFMTTDNGQ